MLLWELCAVWNAGDVIVASLLGVVVGDDNDIGPWAGVGSIRDCEPEGSVS